MNESIDLESNILETTKTRDDCFKDLNILSKSIDLELNTTDKWLEGETLSIEKTLWERIFNCSKGKFIPKIWTSLFG